MGDAARELPYRLHLLGLAQGVLGLRQGLGLFLLGRDVPSIRVDVIPFRRGVPGDPPGRAVLVPVSILEIDEVARRSRAVQAIPGVVGILRPDELPEAAPDHLRGLVAENCLPGRVDGPEYAVGTDHDKKVARVAPDPVVLGRALRNAKLQRLVEADQVSHDLLLVVDIRVGPDPARHPPIRVQNRPDAGQEPPVGTIGTAEA